MSTIVQRPTAASTISPFSDLPPKYEFSFDEFLKKEYGFGIDADRPLCKAFLQGHCPLGNNCPDKHHAPPGFNSLVCKHWMRALCKKGDHCEFLHEYNLRRMPECKNYNYEHNTCPNGDDCMYQHLTPESKLPSCPSYERGFCPLGPICARRHIKKEKLCPFYVAGFCPYGKECQEGAHARFPMNLPKPDVKGTVDLLGEQEKQQNQYQQMQMMGGMEDDGSGMAMPFRTDDDGQDRPQRDFGQGRGRGGWPQRGKGRGRGRGRGRGAG